MKDKSIFSAMRMVHKDYDRNDKKNSGRDLQGGWRKDELIGGKPLLVK
jgi:hypothetical protein